MKSLLDTAVSSQDQMSPPTVGVRARSEVESRALYARIKSSITEGRFPPGAQLPTERALSTEYRVARNTVRKTMAQLMQEGLIIREVGRGTFVTDRKPAGVAPAEPEFSLPELFEARLLFEPALVDLVVERATEADFAAFDAALADMKAADTWIAYKEAKYALHLAIARASLNRFIARVLEMIIASRRAAGWGRPGGHPGPLALVRETACRDNAAIIAALRARDATRARELMRDYLVRTLYSVSGA
ncbi:FadR/GntR family transcriptional regulator [Chelatococcus asaccharovorans]|uniref:FadR/GntR family transcriptional regulator n=1 Tax=Chelatococcus asaccharovorans TaxID=28210 RepID=UPI0022647265|nr:GntR family transcriptional regulator [Chelatococcus asaccharovorans]